MRQFAIAAVGAIFIAVGAAQVGLAAPGPGGLTTIERGGSILLVQDKKQETVTQKVKKKVKRAWKRIAGYKFAVACPAFPQITHKICTDTGKDREAARAKCQAQNMLCSVTDAK